MGNQSCSEPRSTTPGLPCLLAEEKLGVAQCIPGDWHLSTYHKFLWCWLQLQDPVTPGLLLLAAPLHHPADEPTSQHGLQDQDLTLLSPAPSLPAQRPAYPIYG